MKWQCTDCYVYFHDYNEGGGTVDICTDDDENDKLMVVSV